MSSVQQASERRIGETLKGKWVLERLIAVGGMAAVYVARHQIGHVDAIKMMHAEQAASAEARARFEQEARAANAFKHPGVVEIRDIDVAEDGTPFLVMELLEGETLSERVRREGPVTELEALRIASETLDVLGAAHERAIIHRDVKPENLFLTSEGKVKVLDFGIARVRSKHGTKITREGITLGTMTYMPPEQARGASIDARADIYAVGATMFRILANRPVHDSRSNSELMRKVVTESAPSLGAVAPAMSPELVTIVDRALRFEPLDRFPDAASMKREVDRVLSARLAGGAEAPLLTRSSRPPHPHGAQGDHADPTTPELAPTNVAPVAHVTEADSADLGVPRAGR